MGTVKYLKLVNGEELMGCIEDDGGFSEELVVEDPCRCIPGPGTVHVDKYPVKKFRVEERCVMFIGDPTDAMLQVYAKATSRVMAVRPNLQMPN